MNKLISIVMHFIAAICCLFCAIIALAALDSPYHYIVATWSMCAGILIWDSIPEDNTKGK